MIILNHTTKYLFIEWDDGWNTDFTFKFVLANPMTGKVKKSVFHPSSHSINKYFVV